MKHEKEHKNRLEPLLNWLIGDATRHDERALDASAKADPFLADALEGYRTMPEADHAADVTRLKARLRKQSERRKGVGFYLMRIAAVGAVLVAAWVVMQQFQSSEKSVAVAESAPASETAETAAINADSIGINTASQAASANETADDRLAAQENFSPRAKKTAPPPVARTEGQPFDYSQEREAAEAAAPPPALMMDSQPAPANAAIAIEEAQAAPQKSEALSKARMEAKKLADTMPAAKPGAPAEASRKITGKVTDENGEPLIAVTIEVNGTDIGTATDQAGTYSLAVPVGSESLVFSYTGYSQMNVTLGNSDKIDVSLGEGDALLSEVLVPLGAAGSVRSPQPVGGFRAYKKYVADNLRHPDADQQPRPRQVVRVKFMLQSNGSPSNFTATDNAPQSYQDEAIRLLREGPRWNGTTGTTASFRFVFE